MWSIKKIYIYIFDDIGSVWIEFILLKLKTENWKHCTKIIFKYVNSAVRPIFNEKVAEKWNLWVREQCMDTLFTMKKSTNVGWKKKYVEIVNAVSAESKLHHK